MTDHGIVDRMVRLLRRRIWRWRGELDIPNALLDLRSPWGFYLRTRRLRITAGPLFGWKAARL